MKYQQETVLGILPEILPLLEANFSETEEYISKLNPDLSLYFKLAKSDMYYVFTARTDEGELVGYIGMLVQPALHDKDTITATNDIWYVSPKHRGKFTGLRLIKYAESELRPIGVNYIFLHTKVINDLAGMLKRVGYSPHEIVSVKRLEKP